MSDARRGFEIATFSKFHPDHIQGGFLLFRPTKVPERKSYSARTIPNFRNVPVLKWLGKKKLRYPKRQTSFASLEEGTKRYRFSSWWIIFEIGRLDFCQDKKDPLSTRHRRHRPISGQHHTAVADIAKKLCIYLLQPQIASSILCLVVLASSNLIVLDLAFSILLPFLSFLLQFCFSTLNSWQLHTLASCC